MNSHLIKDFLPPFLIRKIRGMRYGWHGKYKTWADASSKCSGYDNDLILNKVRESALKVKSGDAIYERDSVIFDKREYAFPVLSTMLALAIRNNGKLNVIDFGGSLGSTYFQNKLFLDRIPVLNWCIVEQPDFVKTGRMEFQDERLKFFNSIDECTNSYSIDIILLSSVLQYLEKPFAVVENAYLKSIRYLIIDRTPFVKGEDRITIQNVPPSIYKATYPCWFFNERLFLQKIGMFYIKAFEFKALDEANLKSEFKGFFFEIRNNNSLN